MTKNKVALILTVFFLLFLCGMFYDRKLAKERFESGVQTVGTVWPAGKDIEWQYLANGSYYKQRQGNQSNPYLEYGEVFKVYYEKKNPGQASIALWEPVFDTTKYVKILTEPIHNSYEKGITLVSYNYKVHEKVYHRIQQYEFLQDFQGNGLRYYVYYDTVQPKIAYVNFSVAVK